MNNGFGSSQLMYLLTVLRFAQKACLGDFFSGCINFFPTEILKKFLLEKN
jgi:hypothetical protein